VHFLIKDSGPGLDLDAIDKIFEPFFTTKSGLGLGLSISRSIIESHGGRIWATPRLHGTQIDITLCRKTRGVS
jgi:signal transduction histidine kinase